MDQQDYLQLTPEQKAKADHVALSCSAQAAGSLRFLVVQEGLECTVWDKETRKHLFPISDGCGLGTAEMIAGALNYYVANDTPHSERACEQPRRLNGMVLCSRYGEGCVYEKEKVCQRGINCEHQITEAEVYESKKQHEEASRPQ